jgi:hypothetical protein
MKIKRIRVKGKKLNACQRSLAMLRKLGWICDVAEKYVARVAGAGQQQKFGGGYRKDLMGFIDILAIRRSPAMLDSSETTLAIQTTSRMQVTAHLRSYRRDPEIRERILAWLACPSRGFVIHGWEAVSIPKKSGDGDKVAWQLTERVITAADLAEEVQPGLGPQPEK